jgi:two-component system, OmpR family, phosphate regulon sensor histidine kinase PhoR
MEYPWLLTAVLLVTLIVLAVRYRNLNAGNQDQARVISLLREQNQRVEAHVTRDRAMRDALADAVIDPVFFVDAEHTVTLANQAARRLFKDADPVERSLIEVTRSHELDAIADDVLSQGAEQSLEAPRELMLNERLYRVRAAAMPGEDGPASGAVLILRDVSELQRLGRARRDFVANISHELRTPLTAIRLLVDTLRLSDGDAQQHARLLDQVSDQTDALTQITQELYDLAQIESGRVPMRMVRTSLHELAGSAFARLQPQADRAGLQLRNEVGPDVYALVDPDQIRRVLSNLVHNAIKFTPGGSITLFIAPESAQSAQSLESAVESADYLTVGVRDTGVGIPRSELPRIFERFYKVSRARGQGGTGLGLAIAKHIVEAHGGRIWAESVEGRGAAFYFTVPRD